VIQKKAIPPEDVIVVDDFYNEPTSVRNFALGLKYVRVPEYTVAAMQSVDCFYSAAVIQRLEEAVRGRISFDQQEAAFGKFRLMYKDATSRLHIHSDLHPWAGVLYLTPDTVSRGGTGFFWHKETGCSGPPPSNPKRFDSELDGLFARDSIHIEKWEMFHMVPFKFNRLVIFRGDKYFHGTYKRFGDNPNNGRLTQNFFFHVSN
jgi:hypothetical protein